jgi:hypothetical protein
MMRKLTDFKWPLGAVAFLGLACASLASDSYTAGFYTRGTDTIQYLDRGDAIYDPFYVPMGPFVFVPRVSLTATYEDNLFLDAENAESGVVFMLAPGGSFIWGRSQGNNVTLDTGLLIPLYDSSNDLEDKPSYFVTLSSVYALPKTELGGRIGYRRLEDVDTVEGARIVKDDFVAGVTADYRVSQKTSVGALGAFERHDFDADRYVDYDRYYGALRFYHHTTPRSQVFVQGGLGRDDLDTGDGDYADADFYDLSLGARGKFTPKSSVSGRVGYRWREYDDAGIENVEHWIASLSGEVTPMSFTTFRSEITADIRPVISDAGSASIDQRWLVGVTRRLGTERLRGNAAAFIGRVDYRSPRTEPGRLAGNSAAVYDRREDDYWGFSLGMDWWTRQNLSFGLSYDYINNDGARGADAETRRAAKYDAGRWTGRMSWNY